MVHHRGDFMIHEAALAGVGTEEIHGREALNFPGG